MNINFLSLCQFRNIKKLEVEFCPQVNIIYGDNGQGKTNIVEAIWLCTGAKSFRGAKNEQFIQIGEKFCQIDNLFYGAGRQQECKLTFSPKKKAFLNKIELDTALKLAGNFCCVVFSPCHLSLVKNGPEERRKFLDSAICQIKPNYLAVLAQYKKVLQQKNTAIKNSFDKKIDESILDIFDTQLAHYGIHIIRQRLEYVKKLREKAVDIYYGISSEKEVLDISYKSFTKNEEELTQEILFNHLKRKRMEDLRYGYTSTGPHRDDLNIQINLLSARDFGSQGQQRSCILALKLAESSILREVINEPPVIVLDDVLSELDAKRQDFLINQLHGQQIFITCCDNSFAGYFSNGRAFYVKEGTIEQKG